MRRRLSYLLIITQTRSFTPFCQTTSSSYHLISSQKGPDGSAFFQRILWRECSRKDGIISIKMRLREELLKERRNRSYLQTNSFSKRMRLGETIVCLIFELTLKPRSDLTSMKEDLELINQMGRDFLGQTLYIPMEIVMFLNRWTLQKWREESLMSQIKKGLKNNERKEC